METHTHTQHTTRKPIRMKLAFSGLGLTVVGFRVPGSGLNLGRALRDQEAGGALEVKPLRSMEANA